MGGGWGGGSHINAVRCRLLQGCLHELRAVVLLVVDARVDAKLVHEIVDLLWLASNAHHAAALDLRNLSDNGSHSSGSAADNHLRGSVRNQMKIAANAAREEETDRLALLGLASLQKAKVRRSSRLPKRQWQR